MENVNKEYLNYHNPKNKASNETPVVSDVLSFIFGMLGGATRTGFNRLFKGALRESWSWKLELIIGSSKGTYNLLNKIGPLRYQRVLQGLLPNVIGKNNKIFVRKEIEAPGYWFIPEDPNDLVILYFHGGGYVYGSMKTHGLLIESISSTTSARVLAIDYSLAPENPHPAAVDDACSAYRFLLKSGISPNNIIFAGDSAGGGLVISALIALRDKNEVLPVAGVCISPWVDLECKDKSFDTNSTYDAVSREACLIAAKGYLNGLSPKLPLASPLFADIRGLPPLLIQVGELEVLYDQIIEFAERAKVAEIETKLSVYKDMIHVWHMYIGFTPQSEIAINEIAKFILSKRDIR